MPDHDCTESDRLSRMEANSRDNFKIVFKKLDDIHELVTQQAVQGVEIEQLKKDVAPVPSLVSWRDKWAGVNVFLSILAVIIATVAALFRIKPDG